MARLTTGMGLDERGDKRGDERGGVGNGEGGDVHGGVCGEIGDKEVVGRQGRHDICPLEMGREEAVQEENGGGLVVIE